MILTEKDVLGLELLPAEIFGAVEQGLVAEWQDRAWSEPTISYQPLPDAEGLVSIVRGTLADADLAMIKTVGTFPGNQARGLPSNPGLLSLLDARTGFPVAHIDAAPITTLRTAAVTAVGARHLARKDSRILGCIGSRGITLQAAHYIAGLFDLQEIRIHSPKRENREAAVTSLSASVNCHVVSCDRWQSCLENADILIDGSSLTRDQVLFPADVLAPGATLVAYGFHSSMPPGVFARVDQLIVDRWAADGCGAFGPMVAAGEITADSVDAHLGGIIAGEQPGRRSPQDCVVFWHRGVAACDIALAQRVLDRASAATAFQSSEN